MVKQVSSGFVTLLGLPNAGKSSLLNRLVGEEVAIVTPKAQTTWQTQKGHVLRLGLELVVIDTPGIQEGTRALNSALSRNASRAVASAREGREVVALMADAIETLKAARENKPNPILAAVRVLERDGFHLPLKMPLIPTVNKADMVKKPEDRALVEQSLMAAATQVSSDLKPIHWVSARLDAGIAEWIETVKALLPQDEPGKLFDPETISDRSIRDIVSEYIREQCFMQLGEEVPYSIAVQIERFDERDAKTTHIEAVLHVEKESQKPIVIGKGGEKIKAIGTAARLKVEKLLGRKAFVGLRVKVTPQWARDPVWVERFGYAETK